MAVLTISGEGLACGSACMMIGSAITPCVGVGVGVGAGVRLGVDVLMGIYGSGVSSPDELLIWQPLTPNQNRNKNTVIIFKRWMDFMVCIIPYITYHRTVKAAWISDFTSGSFSTTAASSRACLADSRCNCPSDQAACARTSGSCSCINTSLSG